MRVLPAVALASVIAAAGCGGKFGANEAPLAVRDAAAAPEPPPPPPAPPIPDPAPTPFDAGGGGASDSAVQCQPGEVSSFAPEWRPPAGVLAGACSAAQLDMAADACFGAKATVEACDAWRASGSADGCLACLLSPAASRVWAPIITTLGNVELFNVGGCIVLADPTQLGCAQAVQAVFECDMAACFSLCALPDSGQPFATQEALDGCFKAAESSGCTAYAKSAAACVGDAGTASFCYRATQDDGALVQLLGLACGQGDGG
jgi:hypothetical protein